MAKAKKKETKVVAKNYKSVLLETLIDKKIATCQELTSAIQAEIEFLKFESPYKVKAEYVLPTLEKSKCFEQKDKNTWTLSSLFLNLENHAHDILRKGKIPLTYEQLTEEIAMKSSLHPSDIPLKLENDARFVPVSVAREEFYFLDNWEFCNEFAFALFVQNGNDGLTEDEIHKAIKSKFNKKSKNAVVLLDSDPRFRQATDGKYSVFPRVIKKFKKKDVSKSILDEIFSKLEAGEGPFSLKDIADEHIDLPYPLTNLEEQFSEDLRFSVSREKVKRSRLSLEEIKEAKRLERRNKKAQKELEEKKKEDEKALLVTETEETAEEAAEVVDLFVAAGEADEEAVDVLSLDKIRETLLGEESSDEVKSTDLGSVLPGVIPAPIVSEGVPSTNTEEAGDGLGFLKRKNTVIKKVVQEDVEDFDLESTVVEQEELADYIKDLTDRDGSLVGISPVRFDEMLRRYLPFRVTDYKSTNPEVADFVVKLARPRLDQIVLDPVCGRGDLILRVLKEVQKTLRSNNSQDLETFETFLDEQVVGLDQSEFIVRGARLALALNNFQLSLMEVANSQEDEDIMIDEMYSMVVGDFSGFNIREMKSYLVAMYRVLCEGGQAVIVMDSDHMEDDREIASLVQEKFLVRNQVIFDDYDGHSRNVLQLVKSGDRGEKTKVFRLENLSQLQRVLDLIY
tara:strand:- start:485 stop:2527 length:2043 start_codon:yes stop_codon:yes gene_type:complete